MNLTVAVDDEVLKRARMRAILEDTSIDAVVREFLESYAGGAARRRRAIEHLLSLSKTAMSGRGPATWTRDELHDR